MHTELATISTDHQHAEKRKSQRKPRVGRPFRTALKAQIQASRSAIAAKAIAE